ncbi:MAG TPA: CDP-alcohol phosphatidyltransferase family protein [Mycobacteriales bacterium]|nr:CDP-alcohol phosphatidyltransferase family protein [Mycobacteriales bacterium]
MPIDAAVLAEWSRRHDGYDPERSLVLRTWLSLVHTLARPLVRRRISPDAVTAASVAAAVLAARAPRPAAVGLVAASVVLDGVDGAVALQSGRSTRWGTAVDHAGDRISDSMLAVALHRAGAERGWCIAAACSSAVFEGARELLRMRAGAPLAELTVGDRPARIAAGLWGLATAPTAGAVAVTALCAVGMLQLVRHADPHPPSADHAHFRRMSGRLRRTCA